MEGSAYLLKVFLMPSICLKTLGNSYYCLHFVEDTLLVRGVK